MYADVEERGTERHGPFERDRNRAVLFHDSEERSSFDVIMVGQGYEGVHTKIALDLFFLEVIGLTRRQRRSPISFGKIQGATGNGGISPLLLADGGREQRHAGRVARHETHAFVRVQGVAMKRNSRAEAL